MRSATVIGVTALLFLQGACDPNKSPALDVREPAVEDLVFRRAAALPGKSILKESSRYNRSTSASSASVLDGRALLAKWLNPQGLEKRACPHASKPALCPGPYTGCCQSLEHCCANNDYCKVTTGDDCCDDGTCRAPTVCDDACNCITPGGTCCSDGKSCEPGFQCCGNGKCADEADTCCPDGTACYPGNICVEDTEFDWYDCCTDSSCTAYVKSGGTTVTISPPQVTEPVIYEYYYYTITWSYLYYFFTYYYVIEASTLTSTYTTTTTELSVYESNSAAAASSFSSMSSSVRETDFTTPSRATTALALSTDIIRPTSTDTSDGSSPTPTPTDEPNGQGSLPGGLGGLSGGSTDRPGVGAHTSVPGWGAAWILGTIVVAVAGGMVWL